MRTGIGGGYNERQERASSKKAQDDDGMTSNMSPSRVGSIALLMQTATIIFMTILAARRNGFAAHCPRYHPSLAVLQLCRQRLGKVVLPLVRVVNKLLAVLHLRLPPPATARIPTPEMLFPDHLIPDHAPALDRRAVTEIEVETIGIEIVTEEEITGIRTDGMAPPTAAGTMTGHTDDELDITAISTESFREQSLLCVITGAQALYVSIYINVAWNYRFAAI